MATVEHRDSALAPEEGARPVAPGALSGLLAELARIPEAELGSATARRPEPGETIGRFELIREIGRGGFGVVYEARDTELRRAVAFKLVRPGRLESGEDQLRREAEVIAQLTHPNLVNLFDVGRSDFGPYLVLELLRGRTLKSRLADGRIPVAESVRLSTEIARGLRHAHAQGVVHRDLKPSNVFLCQDGQVKLLDFGMSHAFGRARVEGGTPAYMAPEQHRGGAEDERTDVFALGVMMFEMLAGKLPFPAEEPAAGGRAERIAPALDVPGAPALGALVAAMLQPEPARRPRSASDVLAALSSIELDLRRAGEAARGGADARRSGLLLVAGAGVVLLLVAAVLGVTMWRRSQPAPPSAARAIAVLPFTRMSGAAEDDYFSDGLAEEILDRLTRLRELKVAARSASFSFKDRKADVAEVARRLRVDVVLEGSVRRDRERLRVTAELVDARSGFRVWSQIYDRRLEDVFAIQDDIARQVVAALELVLSQASRGELGRPRTASIPAYDVYLRARAFLRLAATRQNIDQAIALFDRAIALDARFAPAYAGLCDAWLERYRLGRATDSFANAETACRAALARDDGAGEVYVSLGNLHLASGDAARAEGEFRRARSLGAPPVAAVVGLARAFAAEGRPAEAERAFGEAKQLDPGSWVAHQELGRFLHARGRYVEAAREYREVIALDPENASAHNNVGAALFMAGAFEEAARAWHAALEISPTHGTYSNIGSSYFYLGRFDEAAAMYRRALALVPDDHRLWGNLADAYAATPGRRADAEDGYARAIALGEKRLRVDPGDAATLSDLANYSSALGRAERARELEDEALRRDPQSMLVHFNGAVVAARAGASDDAIAELRRALELGYPRRLLPGDPALASLRNDPRFASLAAQRAQ